MQEIYDLLRLDSGVSGIVGTRITPDMMPQGQPMPAIVFSAFGDLALQVLSGSSDVKNPTITVDCYAKHSPQVQALADAVVAAFTLNGPAPFPRAVPRRRQNLYDDPSEYFRVLVEFSYWTQV